MTLAGCDLHSGKQQVAASTPALAKFSAAGPPTTATLLSSSTAPARAVTIGIETTGYTISGLPDSKHVVSYVGFAPAR
jgi:hypothetical protein